MCKWNYLKKPLTLTFCSFGLSISFTTATAFSVHEGIDGDLSGVDQFPTELVLALGSNVITGSAGSAGLNQDYDIFTFSVLPNTFLSSITLDAYMPGSGVSFVGMQTADKWTAGRGSGISGNALSGWTLFGANNIGMNLLPTMSTAGSGASGFSLPLGSGDYVFLIQDTGSSINYEMTFTASPVPLPASLPLLSLALLGLLRKIRRRVRYGITPQTTATIDAQRFRHL